MFKKHFAEFDMSKSSRMMQHGCPKFESPVRIDAKKEITLQSSNIAACSDALQLPAHWEAVGQEDHQEQTDEHREYSCQSSGYSHVAESPFPFALWLQGGRPAVAGRILILKPAGVLVDVFR